MPPLTRWFIKAAMVALIGAFLSRALITLLPLWGFQAGAAALSPVFLHLFVWGWVTQMIFGVAKVANTPTWLISILPNRPLCCRPAPAL